MRPHLFTIFLLFIFLSFFVSAGYAQRRVSIKGKVMNKKDKQPLAAASVFNISKGVGTMTNDQGEYSIDAADMERLVFSYVGYKSDTVQVNALYQRQILDILLTKRKYSFDPVDIFGQKPDYARDSAERRAWYGTLDEEKTSGLDAVSHPITALYDALSGRMKRIWRFQKDYKAYEEEKYINSRVNPPQIKDLFHLEGDSLKAFLLWYNPPYQFVRNATDYELLLDIKSSVEEFREVYIMRPNMDLDQQNLR